MQQKIVITGGPGTGKTAVINELIARNYYCMQEISRQVTLDARKDGVEQLFLKDPLLFSKMLLKGREEQYENAHNSDFNLVFFDRGVPDVTGYMDFKDTLYPKTYDESCIINRYTHVFLMPPWKEIYLSDNERYETYEESLALYNYLKKAYTKYNYNFIEVPFGSVNTRTNFILETLLIK